MYDLICTYKLLDIVPNRCACWSLAAWWHVRIGLIWTSCHLVKSNLAVAEIARQCAPPYKCCKGVSGYKLCVFLYEKCVLDVVLFAFRLNNIRIALVMGKLGIRILRFDWQNLICIKEWDSFIQKWVCVVMLDSRIWCLLIRQQESDHQTLFIDWFYVLYIVEKF